MKKITREDFGNISEVSFKEIKEYLKRYKNNIEDVTDCHFEKTEEALFNWLHTDTDETPIEIKNAPMPRNLVNVLHVTEGWFFWYV